MSRRRPRCDDVETRLLSFWERRESYGAPIGCIATTYTFDPAFFEQECLGRFVGMDTDPLESGALYMIEREERFSNVTSCVLVDPSHVPAHRSLRWNLIAVRVPGGGLLHAKVSLLVWEHLIRVVVASANLTEQGYRRNYENAAVLDFGPEGEIPVGVLRDVLTFLGQVRAMAPRNRESEGQGPQARLADLLRQTRSRSSGWSSGSWRRGEPQASFLPVFPGRGSLLSRIQGKLLRRPFPQHATIVSPFFDKGANAKKTLSVLDGIMSSTWVNTIHIIARGRRGADDAVAIDVPEELSGFKRDDVDLRFGIVSETSDSSDVRPLHAKSIQLESDRRFLYCVGSSNFTAAGLGLAGGRSNVEANVAFSMMSRNRNFKRLCEWSLPPYEVVDLEEEDVEFLEEVEGETPEPEGFKPLPFCFEEALFEHDDIGAVLVLHIDEDAPNRFYVRDHNGSVLLDSSKWRSARCSSPVSIRWEPVQPPSTLVVKWASTSREWQEALWPVNIADPSDLPAPEEMRDLSTDDLFDMLTSALPLHEAWRRVTRRRRRGSVKHDDVVTDPHKKVDTRSFLLRRVRLMSRALEGMRQRLEAPAFHMDGFRWRLFHNPLGPIPLAKRFANEEEGAAFMIVEVALALSRVDWSASEKTIGRKTVRSEVARAIATLDEIAAGCPSPKNLRSYVKKGFMELTS